MWSPSLQVGWRNRLMFHLATPPSVYISGYLTCQLSDSDSCIDIMYSVVVMMLCAGADRAAYGQEDSL